MEGGMLKNVAIYFLSFLQFPPPPSEMRLLEIFNERESVKNLEKLIRAVKIQVHRSVNLLYCCRKNGMKNTRNQKGKKKRT
jgi:hypothetical protein